jgi:hypothetical protein
LLVTQKALLVANVERRAGSRQAIWRGKLYEEVGEKGEMNLKEALEEIRKEYRNNAVVITSERDRPLGDFIDETDDGREVWLEWGEVSSGGVSVPATHIFFLDEDGFMRHDGSVLSVVSSGDYDRLGD